MICQKAPGLTSNVSDGMLIILIVVNDELEPWDSPQVDQIERNDRVKKSEKKSQNDLCK
jgi:hypothetical protein